LGAFSSPPQIWQVWFGNKKSKIDTHNYNTIKSKIETRIKTIILDETEIAKAAEILRAGGVAAFRTETVFGIGANLENGAKLFAAKNRPPEKNLVMQFAGLPDAEAFLGAGLTPIARALLLHFGGKITVVLPNGQGVRLPEDPVARAILAAVKGPLLVTSANLSGQPDSTTWQAARKALDGRIDAIVKSAPAKIGKPSTIIQIAPETRILREGAAPGAEVLSFIKKSFFI
jgi:L-threonylcarbamoyladenylate synthase